MGLYITLREADGAVVRHMPDPFGGTFEASGDFDDLLNRGTSPMLDAVDPYGVTILGRSDLVGLADEVDALLASVPENKRGHGRVGMAWRGLNRFRVMVGLCESDSRLTLNFLGD